MRYGIAYGTSEENLISAVSKFILKGWKPAGGIAVYSYKDYAGNLLFRFVQAMISESADVEEPETEPAWESEARGLVARGLKINAIKIVRNNTHLGLKEAKDLVEAWEQAGKHRG